MHARQALILIMLPFVAVPFLLGVWLLLRDLRFKRKALRVGETVVGHTPYLHWTSRLGTSWELVASCRDAGGMMHSVRTGIQVPTKKMAEAWLGREVVLLVSPDDPFKAISAGQLYRSGIGFLLMGLLFLAALALALG